MMRQQVFDGSAIGASALCLIHCLLPPLLLIFAPAAALAVSLPEAFHLWALVLALLCSSIALTLGYQLHRRLPPALLATAGLLLLVTAVLPAAERVETLLTVAGSLLLAVGHILNLRAAALLRR
jgi:hypothetical protein